MWLNYYLQHAYNNKIFSRWNSTTLNLNVASNRKTDQKTVVTFNFYYYLNMASTIKDAAISVQKLISNLFAKPTSDQDQVCLAFHWL